MPNMKPVPSRKIVCVPHPSSAWVGALLLLTTACLPAHPQPAPTADAQAAAKLYFNLVFVQCGDSYYEKNSDGLTRYQRLSYQLVSDPITSADRLNGYSWRGEIIVNIEGPYQQYRDGHWNPWSDGGFSSHRRMQKLSGHWQAYSDAGTSASKIDDFDTPSPTTIAIPAPGEPEHSEPFAKFSCADIPKEDEGKTPEPSR